MAELNTSHIEVEINSPINITSEITTGVTLETVIYNGARGRSAYEVWIGEGHVGSEEDFLQWLRVQTAAETTVVDAANNYTSNNVEDILQEVAEMIAATTDKHYVHRQEVSASTWIIVHNLNKFPSVRTYDRYSKEFIGEVTFYENDKNRITINFSGSTAGVAYLN
jgi:hypothetical protein